MIPDDIEVKPTQDITKGKMEEKIKRRKPEEDEKKIINKKFKLSGKSISSLLKSFRNSFNNKEMYAWGTKKCSKTTIEQYITAIKSLIDNYGLEEVCSNSFIDNFDEKKRNIKKRTQYSGALKKWKIFVDEYVDDE